MRTLTNTSLYIIDWILLLSAKVDVRPGTTLIRRSSIFLWRLGEKLDLT